MVHLADYQKTISDMRKAHVAEVARLKDLAIRLVRCCDGSNELGWCDPDLRQEALHTLQLDDALDVYKVPPTHKAPAVKDDGDQFPDPGWLKQEYKAWRHMQCVSDQNLTIGGSKAGPCIIYYHRKTRTEVSWSVNVDGKGAYIPKITTRKQFRDLATLLGVEPYDPKGK